MKEHKRKEKNKGWVHHAREREPQMREGARKRGSERENKCGSEGGRQLQDRGRTERKRERERAERVTGVINTERERESERE